MPTASTTHPWWHDIVGRAPSRVEPIMPMASTEVVHSSRTGYDLVRPNLLASPHLLSSRPRVIDYGMPVKTDLSLSELATRLRQQELVAQFGLRAVAGETRPALLDRVCVVASEGLGTRLAKVLRYRPESNDLLVVAGIGWHPGVVGHRTLGAGLDSPAGYALHSERPVHSDDLATETRFTMPALLTEHSVQSAINVPVMGDGAVAFGVLEADSTHRHEFVTADIAFLQSLANVLSAALTRADTEAAKDQLLRDKDLLMQEVHHRVKNSLQLVRTLLQLQGRTATPEIRSKLDEAALRIMTIGAVHQRLYDGPSVVAAEVGFYLSGLLDDMRFMLPGNDRSIVLTAEPIELQADHLTPLGLIVSELVTNAVKYGKGQISVSVAHAPGGLLVCVTDEGPGFQGNVPSGSLGMRLITALARGDAAMAVQVDNSVPYGRVVVRMTLA